MSGWLPATMFSRSFSPKLIKPIRVFVTMHAHHYGVSNLGELFTLDSQRRQENTSGNLPIRPLHPEAVLFREGRKRHGSPFIDGTQGFDKLGLYLDGPVVATVPAAIMEMALSFDFFSKFSRLSQFGRFRDDLLHRAGDIGLFFSVNIPPIVHFQVLTCIFELGFRLIPTGSYTRMVSMPRPAPRTVSAVALAVYISTDLKFHFSFLSLIIFNKLQ